MDKPVKDNNGKSFFKNAYIIWSRNCKEDKIPAPTGERGHSITIEKYCEILNLQVDKQLESNQKVCS